MSSLLREYPSIFESRKSKLSITATMQGKFGRAVQFTIEGELSLCSVIISENQVEDLIITLQKRIVCEKGYSATDWPENFNVVNPKSKDL